MAIKKTVLKKKIEGVVYDIYQKTSADLVDYSEGITVAAKIASLTSTLEALTTGDTSVDTKIQAASDALFQKIMGVTDQSQLSEAFDTLKEVSDYLAGHGSVVDGFTNDISAIKGRLDTAEGKITALETTVGDAESGLVKDVAANKAAIGDAHSGLVADVATNAAAIAAVAERATTLEGTVGNEGAGLVKDVADNAAAIQALQEVGSTKVEASTTNGNIKIDGVETQVYDDSAIAATKIVEDATHKFATDAEKAAWNATAEVLVAKEVPGDLAETDLLFLDITE